MAFLLWHRVRDTAERYPDRLAISDGQAEMTYMKLVSSADRVTQALVDAGVRPGDRIGILANKSARCVAAMLGATQAGGCYVPVDPRAPAPRSKYILGNAGVRFLVTQAALVRSLELVPGEEGIPDAARILLLDDEPSGAIGEGVRCWQDLDAGTAAFDAPARNEDDPAYMLYTSGSTGNPKGVVISHRNALTFVDWAHRTFDLKPEDRLSNHAPFHFDLSVFDLYGAFSSGASVHVVPDRAAPFPGTLVQWIEETDITVWYSVPSALTRIMLHGDADRFEYARLRTVLFAGEVFPVKHLRTVMDVFRFADFHNLYGPTETNVCTHYSVPRPLADNIAALPIGPTCANMEAFALTDKGLRAGLGEEGELLVRGPCVMLGYWGLPERTARSLGQNPLHNAFHDPVYRTGDRVRVIGGNEGFQFLGRRDHMVKVRGYRIELGEIEQAILAHPDVREAAVVAIEDDEVGARLHAAVVAQEDVSLDVDELHRHCLERIRRYAVPETMIFPADLPRTSTGKTDRIALENQLSASSSPPS
ncbi:MAG: amino acid adenylation domain-containing protein [Dehalococcoidia bacterium]